jgi:hypothetical protein
VKRVAKIGLAVAAIIVIALLVIWLYIGHAGSTELEQWIGRQIVGVLQAHITPRVGFSSLDYQAPRTVVVDEFALTAEDQPIITVERLLLELAEVPRTGKPIQIQRVELDGLHVRVIKGADGRFAGWRGFVQPTVLQDSGSVPEGRRFSDVLVLRHVEIRDGTFTYQRAASEPFTLSDINMELNTPPASDEPGWYALDGVLKREPLLAMELDGRINLDTTVLDVNRLEARASLQPENYRNLGQAERDLLDRYQPQGELTLTMHGQMPLKQPRAVTGQARLDMQDGRMMLGKVPLRFDSLRVHLEAPAGQPEWYPLTCALKREPLLEVRLVGRIDPDTAVLDISNLAVRASLHPENYEMLDQAERALIERYRPQGELTLTMQGQVPLKQPRDVTGRARLDLQKASVLLGKILLPFDAFGLRLKVADRVAALEYETTLLGGQGSGQATLQLDAGHPTDMSWKVENVRIEETLRLMQQDQPQYAGRLCSEGGLRGELTRLPASLSGEGSLDIDQANLVNLPVIKNLLAMVAKARSAIGMRAGANDAAHAEFALQPDHLDVKQAEVITTLAAFRGKGQLGYDGRLNLEVNGGVLSKLHGGLGKVGELFKKMSDKVVTYQVRGTLSEPKVSVKPLGLGK